MVSACGASPIDSVQADHIIFDNLESEMHDVAIYERVSSEGQSLASQTPDLKRWEATHVPEGAKWYADKASGTTMQRKHWAALEADLWAGKIKTVVVWRLDRLGRTAAGLTALFEELRRLKVNLVSLRDGFDLETPSGRLQANVLASMAQFETEVRSERQAAGIAAARADGKQWGGSKKGVRRKRVQQKADAIRKLHASGTPVAEIARACGVSRPTVYSVVGAT